MTRPRTPSQAIRRKPSTKYKWMSYADAHAYENEAKRLEVSRVARSQRGFMRAYQRLRSPERMATALVPQINRFQYWDQRRNEFIARHLAQYKEKPSYRRRLALIMWAFDPQN